jgi:predicted RNase H-like nuclease (RuvC/YqgF family)
MNEAHQKLQRSLDETNSVLEKERQKGSSLQKEMAVRTKQLIAARERNEQIEAMHQTTLQEKDAELARLSGQVGSSHMNIVTYLGPGPAQKHSWRVGEPVTATER